MYLISIVSTGDIRVGDIYRVRLSTDVLLMLLTVVTPLATTLD